MSEDKGGFDLTRRRLLGGITATGAAAAATGAGTFAYFRDTETSTGNTVQAGTMSLDIHDGASLQWSILEATPDGVESEGQDIIMEHTGSVTADHLELDFQNIELEDDDGQPRKENGNWSLSPGPESDPSKTTEGTAGAEDPGAVGLAKYVQVVDMTYDSDTSVDSGDQPLVLVNNGDVGEDADGLDIINDKVDAVTLYDIAHSSNESAFNGLTAPEPGSTAADDTDGASDTRLQTSLKLHPDTPNKFQGDAVLTTVSATLQQDSSQDN